jgi:hypothetical protein
VKSQVPQPIDQPPPITGWRRVLLILWFAAFFSSLVSFLVSFGMTAAFANAGRRHLTQERTEVMTERGVNYFITPAERAVLRTMGVTNSIVFPVAFAGLIFLSLVARRNKRAPRAPPESSSPDQ